MSKDKRKRNTRVQAWIDRIRARGAWGLGVNRKHCIQLKHDKDLQFMVDKGILIRTRMQRWSSRCYQTVLMLREGL